MKTTVPAGDRLNEILATRVSLIEAAYLREPVYAQDTATDPRREGCREWRTL
jgi:hypothetical protein